MISTLKRCVFYFVAANFMNRVYNLFGSRMDKGVDQGSSPKHPLKRLEAALNKCIRVAIPLHTDILRQHIGNIEKYACLEEWEKVNREQINASRTLQQLKADIWALDVLRSQVAEEDLALFERKVDPARELAQNIINEFIDFQKKELLEAKIKSQNLDHLEFLQFSNDSNLEDAPVCSWGQASALSEANVKLEDVKAAEASWKKLHADLSDISETIALFSSVVHQQQESVNSIVDNIEKTKDNVEEGTANLETAVKLKQMMYPLMGAVVGGCMLGPVGLLAGLKIGGAVAVVGGVLGYQGGKLVKKKAEELSDVELNVLRGNERSSSLPDLRAPQTSELNSLACGR